MDHTGRKEGQRMTIDAGTVLGFLSKWGLTATEEEVCMAIGVLLGRLAERGTPSVLTVEGQSLMISKDTLDQIKGAIRQMWDQQTKARMG
jgi:hypothetical protein